MIQNIREFLESIDEKFYEKCRVIASDIYIHSLARYGKILDAVVFSNLNNKPYEVESYLTILQEGYFNGSRC